MRNKLVYSCSVKICASESDKLLESIFCLLLLVETFSLQKVVKMLEEVVVSWQEVTWMWWMMQNFVAQVIQLLKHWLCDGSSVLSGYVMAVRRGHGKNWAHSVDQCQLQALQFSASIALLSLLLKLNAFAGIQKALVDQTGSRAPNSDHDLFWWKFGFGKPFGASSSCNLLAGCCCCCCYYVKSTFCHMSQSNWEMIHCCIE